MIAFIISSIVCAFIGGGIGEVVNHAPGLGALIGFGVNCIGWMIAMGGGEAAGDIIGAFFD